MVVIVVGTAFAIGAGRPNSALEAAAPAAGAALAVAPAEVALTFSDDVRPASSHASVTNAAGAEVADGDVRHPTSRRMVIPVRIAEAGEVTVSYHVAFTDGTVLVGAHQFSVGIGVAPLRSAGAQGSVGAPHEHGVDDLSAALLALDGAVLFGALALLWLRPRRR